MYKIDKIKKIPLITYRFVKFCTVGFSGLFVNLIVLYISQEVILKGIYPIKFRLYLSLALAIFFATINNFLWNRSWTWRDRKDNRKHVFFRQMGQYFVACGLSIALQFILTIFFSRYIHYLIANILAIIMAAIFNYFLNDIWTFAEKINRVKANKA